MKLSVVFAVAALAACEGAGRPTYREPAPTPVERPAPPPERILRRAPDFRFKEAASGKVYFYRGYSEKLPDGTVFKHEVITVQDPDGPFERGASPEERAYALGVLERDWQNKGLDEQLAYHEEVARRGRERRDSLIEDKIAFAEQAKEELEEHLLALEADLQSSTRTTGYKAPEGRVKFLQDEIRKCVEQRAELKARIETLRFLQADRDGLQGAPKPTSGS
jgi:hypothetical protein